MGRCGLWALQGEAGGGLLVRLDERRAGAPTSAEAVAARWFAQDIFADPNLMIDDEETEDASVPAGVDDVDINAAPSESGTGCAQ